MAPKLKISEFLIKHLNDIKSETCAGLYGMIYSGNLLIVGFRSNKKPEFTDVPFNFVTEVDLCGAIVFKNEDILQPEAIDIIKDVDITDNPILLNLAIGRSDSLSAHLYIHGKLEKMKYEIVKEKEFYSSFIHFRVEASLPVYCELTVASVRDCFAGIQKRLTSGEGVFNFNSSAIYLMNSDVKCPNREITENSTVKDLLAYAIGNGDSGNAKKSDDIIDVQLFFKLIAEKDGDVSFAPVIHHKKRNFISLNKSIKIDALSLLYTQTKIHKLYEILIESLCRNLRLSEQCFLQQIQNIDDLTESNQIQLPLTYHFKPEKCGHFITVVYPDDPDEETFKERRLFLHKQFYLPLNRPCFRQRNSVFARGESDGRLLNPHANLKIPIENGEVYAVKGKYAYYHYMQENFNDDGWGCAYRSLQTICSWFWWQAYTNRPVPTHREIQECLARIGDKPLSFVNSKQWIGSTEVSYVLDALLGVQSRILNVTTGKDLPTLAPQLSVHFAMHGSPVMIGGGVLAHTILGININKETNDVKFLILDPHYKGADDLSVVVSKGWCAWKGADFWKAASFYNLCLPEVPHCI